MAGTKQGMTGLHLQRLQKTFLQLKLKIDADGKESYVIKEYSPELLKELEKDPTFGGLAYSDAFTE
jgi:hypothetical protein